MNDDFDQCKVTERPVMQQTWLQHQDTTTSKLAGNPNHLNLPSLPPTHTQPATHPSPPKNLTLGDWEMLAGIWLLQEYYSVVPPINFHTGGMCQVTIITSIWLAYCIWVFFFEHFYGLLSSNFRAASWEQANKEQASAVCYHERSSIMHQM